MLKRLCLIILIICVGFFQGLAAKIDFNKDTFTKHIQTKDKTLREKGIIYYIKDFFQNGDINSLAANKSAAFNLLNQYNPDNREAYKSFIESICYSRSGNQDEAESSLVKAIRKVNKNTDHFLLYIFLSHLAVIQTDRGNAIDAIYSYWKAKKEVAKLNDYHPQEVLDINISDLYYKNSVYGQSLFYLDQAYEIIKKNHQDEKHLLTIIYYNKAENYFRMGNLDSLKVYNLKLKGGDNLSSRLFNYRNRTDYYLQLLKHNYKGAIKLITTMQQNKLYQASALDKQHLADAYFMDGQTDSAKKKVDELFEEPLEANNPAIKFHLYEMLAAIAEKNNDYKLAADNYNLALKESKNNLNKLSQVGNVSSQMKMDEIESSYIQRAEDYKKERLLFMFILIVTVLLLLMSFMLYRSIRQKRHYEKLLYTTKRHELAVINSHEVRRHLTNILGMIDVIRQSKDEKAEFSEARDYLYYSAEQLDEAIKNIAKKLDD